MQRIAKAAVASGASTKEVKMLARAGFGGKWTSSIWRDLKWRLKSSLIWQSLHEVSLPVLNKAKKLVHRPIGMLLPHVLFFHLYNKFPKVFKEVVLGGSFERVEEFWDAMSDHPSMVNHPVKEHRRFPYRTKAVPLLVHADGTASIGIRKAWGKMSDCIYRGGHCCPKGKT